MMLRTRVSHSAHACRTAHSACWCTLPFATAAEECAPCLQALGMHAHDPVSSRGAEPRSSNAEPTTNTFKSAPPGSH
eukprot:562754-Rhodomonas_salina.2